MECLSVVGARPQFIKLAPVSWALRRAGVEDRILHTGQHYEHKMSQVFFEELEIPRPDINLEVGSGTHGQQTARMLEGIEKELLANRPDWLIVYGDTNSTLAGALAAVKLGVKVAHVEAGLRSFNRSMPEEHNRVMTDHCADLLLCPTVSAVAQLKNEGITEGVHHVGDPMLDSVNFFLAKIKDSHVLCGLGLQERHYFLATVHRASNADDPENLGRILEALGRLEEPVVFPVHPRTRNNLATREVPGNVKICDPVSYLEMLALEKGARAILTDSGGVQKEAYFLKVPCVTMRTETEWTETVESGWNTVAGLDPDRIVEAARAARPAGEPPRQFGNGDSADRIVAALERTTLEGPIARGPKG